MLLSIICYSTKIICQSWRRLPEQCKALAHRQEGVKSSGYPTGQSHPMHQEVFPSPPVRFSLPKSNPADPPCFVGQQIVLRRAWPESIDDYVAVIAGHSLARITLVRRAGDLMVWSWSVTGLALPGNLKPSGGQCETLVQAKKMVRAKFN